MFKKKKCSIGPNPYLESFLLTGTPIITLSLFGPLTSKYDFTTAQTERSLESKINFFVSMLILS